MSDARFSHLYTAKAQGAQPSAIREICKLIDQPDMKSLAGGWPNPAVFPDVELAEFANEILTQHADRALQYGTTEGVPALRELLAERTETHYGFSSTTNELTILHGSQQGMDLAARVLIEPGDVVLAGLPTYFGGTGAITACGGEVIGVPVDENGLNIDILEETATGLIDRGRHLKGVYVIPNFQNPTGTTLPLARRQRLLKLAERFDFLIFEDDPYGDLRFEGDSLPSLRALDGGERVIHIHSMSKTFAPGLRVAWMTAEADLSRRMVIAKQFVDCCTNSLAQYLALAFIRSGSFDNRIQSNIAFYKQKRDLMLGLIDEHFPKEVTVNRPQGGFFVFAHLPEHLDADDLLKAAIKHGVVFVAGRAFFIDGGGRHTFRLSYSQADDTVIREAISILGELIHEQIGRRSR